MDEPLSVIGAFLDRERVDPHALTRALSTDEGRQYLVEVVMLREVTVDQAPAPEMPRAEGGRSVRRWLLVAATVTVGTAGGYLAGQHRPVASAPVAVARPAAITNTVPVVPVAPPPTQVITLEPGVNWRDAMGGD